MAAPTIGEDDEGIEFISLPCIDLRCFAADELHLVAQFSGHFPEADSSNIVVPKIDRTCFNESAGSRKQTYNSRSSSKHLTQGLRASITAAAAAVVKGRTIGVASTSGGPCCEGGVHDHSNVRRILGVETRSTSAKAVARLISKRKTTTKSLARQVVWTRAAENEVKVRRDTWEDGRRPQDGGDSLEEFGSSEDLLRMDSDCRKTRGAANLEMVRAGGLFLTGVQNDRAGGEDKNGLIHRSSEGIAGAYSETWSKETFWQPIEGFNDSESEDGMARRDRKRNNASRDLKDGGLARVKKNRSSLPDRIGDPLLERRNDGADRTRKRAGEGDMVDRLAKMKGKWSSSERTLKIVDATGFPVGWTVRVGLSHKDGRTLFEYRDWRSPEGNQWPSFKDASAYLLSSIGHASTPGIVVLLKPGPGISCDKEISAAKKEGTYDKVFTRGENLTRINPVVAHMHSRDLQSQRPSEALDDADIGKGEVHGLGFCCQRVSRVHLDQCLGVYPVLDKITTLKRPAIEEEVASPADQLIFEEDHRTVLNAAETHHCWQSARKMRCKTAIEALLEKHCRWERLTKTYEPSQETHLKEFEKKLNLGSTTRGMESRLKSGPPNFRDAVCCSGLMPSNPSHKCSFCGMMFSTLLKLRRHLRRVKHVRCFKCDVCGRHFSSIALLLGHRVKLGHPRVTKVTSASTRLQAKKSLEPVARSSGSEMSKIVSSLLSDTYGASDCNVDHESFVDKSMKKSTENLKELREEGAQKSCDIPDMFACKICQKVFHHRSQYWGHMSVHSKKRKKAWTPHPQLAVSGSDSKRFSSRVADRESNFGKMARHNSGGDPGDHCPSKSVFWKLLDDP